MTTFTATLKSWANEGKDVSGRQWAFSHSGSKISIPVYNEGHINLTDELIDATSVTVSADNGRTALRCVGTNALLINQNQCLIFDMGDVTYFQDGREYVADVDWVTANFTSGGRWTVKLTNIIYAPPLVQDHLLDEHTDVDTSTVPPTDGQVLTWDNAAGEWQPKDSTGGVSLLDDLDDVDTSTVPPVIGSGIRWDGVEWTTGPPDPNPHRLMSGAHSDTLTTAPLTAGQHLEFDGVNWTNADPPSGGVTTLVDLTDTTLPKVTYADLDTFASPVTRYRNDQLTDAATWSDSIGAQTPYESAGVGLTTIGANGRNAVNIGGTQHYSLETAPVNTDWTITIVFQDFGPPTVDRNPYFTWQDFGPSPVVPYYATMAWTTSTGTNGFDLYLNDTSTGAETLGIPDPDYPVSQWTGVPGVFTVTYDGSTAKLYTNGVLTKEGPIGVNMVNLRYLELGINFVGRAGPKKIGEVIVHASALTSDQVGSVSGALRDYFHNVSPLTNKYLFNDGTTWHEKAIVVADIADYVNPDTAVTGFCFTGSTNLNTPDQLRGNPNYVQISWAPGTERAEWIRALTAPHQRVDQRRGLILIKSNIDPDDFRIWQCTGATTYAEGTAGSTDFSLFNLLTLLAGPNTAYKVGVEYHVSFLPASVARVDELIDTNVTAPASNHYLGWNVLNSEWENRQVNYTDLAGTNPSSDTVTGFSTKWEGVGPPTTDGGFSFSGVDFKIWHQIGGETIAQSITPHALIYFFNDAETVHNYALFKIDKTATVTNIANIITASPTVQIHNTLTLGATTRMIILPASVDTLAAMQDVTMNAPTTGSHLLYTTVWENRYPNQGTIKVNSGGSGQPTFTSLTTPQTIGYTSPLSISSFPTSSPSLAINGGAFVDSDIILGGRFLEQQLPSAIHGGQIHIWRFILNYSNKPQANRGIITITISNSLSGFQAKASFSLPQGVTAENDRYSEAITIADDASKLPAVGGSGQGYDLTIESSTSLDVTITSIARIAFEYAQRG